MVAAILSIKVSLLLNVHSRHRSSALTAVALLLVLVALAAVGCVLLPDQLTGPGQRADWTLVGGTALVLTWSLSPLLKAGTDRSLSIDSLRLFPLRRRDAMTGLGLASLVGLPGVVLCSATAVLVALATVHWVVLPMYIGAGITTIVVSVLARQSVVDALGLVAAVRHRREAVGIAVLVMIVLALPAVLLTARAGISSSWMAVDRLAPIAAWTPFGAPWASAAAMAAGRVGEAVAFAMVALASVLVALTLWSALVALRLRPTPSHGRTVAQRSLGMLSAVPDSVVGAVAARTLIGWIRDPRYSNMWAFALALPSLGAALSIIGDTYSLLMGYALFSLFLITTTGALDISNDGKAHAVHLIAPVPGLQDALGRLAGHVLASGPFIMLSVVMGFLVMPAITAVGFAGVTLALAGGSLGAARATTAWILVPVASGSQDALEGRQGSGLPTLVHYAVSGATACATAMIPAGLTLASAVTGSWQAAAAAMVSGLVMGTGAVWLGLRVGARVLDSTPHRTYAEILRVS